MGEMQQRAAEDGQLKEVIFDAMNLLYTTSTPAIAKHWVSPSWNR